MSGFFHTRPSHAVLGILTFVALFNLVFFGLWIQALEAAVTPLGMNVLNIEFAVLPEIMDGLIGMMSAANVLHVEVTIDQLDVFMMPGWVIVFFCIQLIGIRALRALDESHGLRRISWKLLAFPILAGACDTVENFLIYHVLTNPSSYARPAVGIMFIFVMAKWTMLVTSMVLGGIMNMKVVSVVIKRAMAHAAVPTSKQL
nr:hypothetical protein [Candidatus Sigynarchaeota archaeon]